MPDRSPLVLIHGFTGEPRSWDPLVPLLEPRHEVHALHTLGHHGGPPWSGDLGEPLVAMVDALERDLDAHGLETAHLVGSSLGGQLAIELAARGRARSVVALAPGGGWQDDRAVKRTIRTFRRTRKLTPWAARNARSLVSRPGLRKLVFRDVVAHGDRIPPAVAAAMLEGAAQCTIFDAIGEGVEGGRWRTEDLRALDVPVRVVWGTADRILPIPHATGHWREFLQGAEWIELDGLGHLPWLDDPQAIARLILQVTAADAAVVSSV